MSNIHITIYTKEKGKEELTREQWYDYDYSKVTYHRDSGPAREDADGYKEWWLNGKRHRDSGPAVEFADGYKAWYINGKYHRDSGPAIEFADGSKWWYINGKEVTEEEAKAYQCRNGHNYVEVACGDYVSNICKRCLGKEPREGERYHE